MRSADTAAGVRWCDVHDLLHDGCSDKIMHSCCGPQQQFEDKGTCMKAPPTNTHPHADKTRHNRRTHEHSLAARTHRHHCIQMHERGRGARLAYVLESTQRADKRSAQQHRPRDTITVHAWCGPLGHRCAPLTLETISANVGCGRGRIHRPSSAPASATPSATPCTAGSSTRYARRATHSAQDSAFFVQQTGRGMRHATCHTAQALPACTRAFTAANRPCDACRAAMCRAPT